MSITKNNNNILILTLKELTTTNMNTEKLVTKHKLVTALHDQQNVCLR